MPSTHGHSMYSREDTYSSNHKFKVAVVVLLIWGYGDSLIRFLGSCMLYYVFGEFLRCFVCYTMLYVISDHFLLANPGVALVYLEDVTRKHSPVDYL
jgi:hypothetical protein